MLHNCYCARTRQRLWLWDFTDTEWHVRLEEEALVCLLVGESWMDNRKSLWGIKMKYVVIRIWLTENTLFLLMSLFFNFYAYIILFFKYIFKLKYDPVASSSLAFFWPFPCLPPWTCPLYPPFTLLQFDCLLQMMCTFMEMQHTGSVPVKLFENYNRTTLDKNFCLDTCRP